MRELRHCVSEEDLADYLVIVMETFPSTKVALLQGLFEELHLVSMDKECNMNDLALASIMAPLLLRKEAEPSKEAPRKAYRYKTVIQIEDFIVLEF